MKIIIYSSTFFPLALGGCFSAMNVARGLRRAGHEVVLLIEPNEESVQGEGEFEGFPVFAFRLMSGGKLSKLKEWSRYVRFLFGPGRGHEIFHLSGASYVSLLMAWLFRCLCGGRTLVKVTLDGGDSIEALKQERHGWLTYRLYKAVDAVVPMTSGQAARLEEAGYRGRVQVIPNAVDGDRFIPMSDEQKREARKAVGIPGNAFLLCYAGYLGGRKGTDVLMHVFSRMLQELTEIHLLTVGNYAKRYRPDEALREFCRERGVPDDGVGHPHLHRFDRVDDMERYIGMADVFLFPSRREGFGTVQIEAMACGLPCLVNYLPGVTEDIFPDDSCGIVIRDNSVDDYVEQLLRLYREPERRARLGKAARRRVEDYFSIESVAEKYIRLYEVLQRADPPTHKATEDREPET